MKLLIIVLAGVIELFAAPNPLGVTPREYGMVGVGYACGKAQGMSMMLPLRSMPGFGTEQERKDFERDQKALKSEIARILADPTCAAIVKALDK